MVNSTDQLPRSLRCQVMQNLLMSMLSPRHKVSVSKNAANRDVYIAKLSDIHWDLSQILYCSSSLRQFMIKKRSGNLLSRKKVLVIFHENNSTNIPTDLYCLTSNKTGVKNTIMQKEDKAVKNKIDIAAGNNVSNWYSNSVIGTVVYRYCSRPRCLF